MSLALGLGIVAAKSVAAAWGGSDVGSAVGDVGALFGNKLADVYAQRRAARQFEDLADVIAKSLEPYIESELRDTAEFEVEAAVLAAGRAIERGSNASAVVDVGLESAALAARLLLLDSQDHRTDSLSTGAENLYLLLIDQASAYIVSLSTKLPNFTLESTRSLLSSTNRILEIAEEIVRTMPRTGPNDARNSGEIDRFRQQYLNNVYERANQLRLYGVDAVDSRSSYELSVAYIPLQVQRDVAAEQDDDEGGSLASAIGDSNRILISGDAGSGKTTLLQWLTVNACRSAFSDDLERLNGRIPFLIRLRNFADTTFPRPEEFVQHTAPFIAGAMPPGWVEQTLAQGSALIMIDGFDELGDEKRAASIEWVDELVATYPETTVIVTSRDAAVEKSWTLGRDYRRARLLPMSWSNMREFIDHWHGAAQANASNDEADDIQIASRRILADIRDRPPLKALCTSPLLCALLCAMNLVTGARLPANRMGVYRSALQMLLERRDSARRIHSASSATLSYDTCVILLGDFAKWMQDNAAADASIEDLRHSIDRTLPRLQTSKLTTTTILEYLLERSGVIRQPSVGRVDFIHRTFLEYLAAWALVEENSMSRLVGLASDDYWREVIVMAAGHAPEAMRRSLIEGLLDRGDLHESDRHASYLVAVSCMETAGTIPVALRRAIADRLTKIMPPRNMTDAAALAAAGNLAVPLLKPAGQGAVEAMACVRALSLIGGEQAFEALKAWGADSRVTVARQLIRAWQNFEPEAYAKEVLAQSSLDWNTIRITDAEQLDYVDLLPHALDAHVVLRGRSVAVEKLVGSSKVTFAHLSSVNAFPSLVPLLSFPRLSELILEDTEIRSLDGLGQLGDLRQLTLINPFGVEDWSAISGPPSSLSKITLRYVRVSSLPKLHGIDSVYIGASSIRRFEGMVGVRELTLGYMDSGAGLEWLADADGLESLTLSEGSGLATSGPVKLPRSLESLSIFSGVLHELPQGARSLVHLRMPLDQLTSSIRSWIEMRPVRDLHLMGGKLMEPAEVLSWLASWTSVESVRFQVGDSKVLQSSLGTEWKVVSTLGSACLLERLH